MKKTFLAAAAVAALAITAASTVEAADAPKAATSAAKPAAGAAKPATTGAKAAPAKPTPEQIANMQRAARILRAFNVVFEAKDTSQPVKNALLACLYNNKLATISAAAGQVMAKNPALKEDNLNDVLQAAGGVCGLKFEKKAAAAGTAPATAPAPASAKPAAPAAGSTGR